MAEIVTAEVVLSVTNSGDFVRCCGGSSSGYQSCYINCEQVQLNNYEVSDSHLSSDQLDDFGFAVENVCCLRGRSVR